MEFRLDAAEATAQPVLALEVYRELAPALRVSGSAFDQAKIDALLRVAGNSRFLARWARRNPTQALAVLSERLETPLDAAELNRRVRLALTAETPSRDRLAELLLEQKYRSLFRISLRDVGMNQPFRGVVSEFSALARTIVQSALDWHLADFKREFGTAVGPGKTGSEIPFCVLAMGKLGGDELNFSSDIDIVYFYGDDEGRVSRHPELTPHEYFTKLAERLSDFLRRKTPDGFLYRVDLDLRPEGKAGALVNSVDAMESYYESFGADWEKQAMIRASLAAGDAELCQDFLRRIHPFVFPKVSDFGYLQRLKRMKEKILDSIRDLTTPTFHVKLGEGGIREAEFFVQSLQMLFGGQDASLQIPNTLDVLPRLTAARLIDGEEEALLSSAYVFLRILEHRLQLADEQQLHQLPAGEEELGELARRMSYSEPGREAAVAGMFADLQRHRGAVQEAFNDLMAKRFEAST